MSSGQSRPLLPPTPVRGRPSGTGFYQSRSAKRKDTRIYIGRVYDRWFAAREEAERGKMLGTSAEQDDEKHVQLLLTSPSQRRLYRRPSNLTPVPASRVARSRCWDIYQSGGAIGLIWCGLGGIGAIFLPQKNRQKKTLNSVTVHL